MQMTQQFDASSVLSRKNSVAVPNPLISATMPLITILIKVRSLRKIDNVVDFRNRVIHEFRRFEEKAQSFSCESRFILAARYCLCAAIDEAVLRTPWGSQSVWGQQSLLSIIHKETSGGERFFIILERMAMEADPDVNFLEFMYVLLSLGFEGKYHGQKVLVINEIRHRLLQRIQMYREYPERPLSNYWRSAKTLADSTRRYLTNWQVILVTAGIVILILIGFRYKTHTLSAPIVYGIEQVNQMEEDAGMDDDPLWNMIEQLF